MSDCDLEYSLDSFNKDDLEEGVLINNVMSIIEIVKRENYKVQKRIEESK